MPEASERGDGATPEHESPALPGSGPRNRPVGGPGNGDLTARLWLTLIPIVVILTLDIATKAWVMNTFQMYEQTPVIGDFFRFTYTHNRGAAFGLDIGEHSRIFFLILSLIALCVLGAIYRGTPSSDRLRILAISLVSAGALGNIWDRIRLEAGVVDFLDFGIGTSRFPIFNIADSAVTVGAVLLLISFWLEGRREREMAAAEATPE